MKPSISRKMNMVKNIFIKHKRLEEHLLSVDDYVFNHEIYEDENFYNRVLLNENKSKKKDSNKKICRIKNNKGDFVDIKKIRNDDTHLLELPPPEDDSNLISIGNQLSIPESLNLLRRIKRGKIRFKDFGKKSRQLL